MKEKCTEIIGSDHTDKMIMLLKITFLLTSIVHISCVYLQRWKGHMFISSSGYCICV